MDSIRAIKNRQQFGAQTGDVRADLPKSVQELFRFFYKKILTRVFAQLPFPTRKEVIAMAKKRKVAKRKKATKKKK